MFLTGVFPRDKGEIEFDGKELKNITIKQSENLGIAFVHQELNLFNDLKVYENIFLQKEYTTKFGCLDKEKNDSGGRETVPGTGSGY